MKTLHKILYIEDDDDIAEITELALQDLGGFDVCHARSGKEGLRLFTSYRPHLILMDVMMPDMDGPETLRQLRQQPQGRHIPVIFMTAKAQLHEQEAYHKMGALGVIVKPFDVTHLCTDLQQLWEKRHV